jgi:hypothetical protein
MPFNDGANMGWADMRKYLFAGLLAIAFLCGEVQAQMLPGLFPSGTVFGNPGGVSAVPVPTGAPVLNGGPLTINPTAGTTTEALVINQATGANTVTGPINLNNILITNDNVNVSGTQSLGGLNLEYHFGGTNLFGVRNGLNVDMQQAVANTNNSTPFSAYKGIASFLQSSTGDGGTDDADNSKGTYLAINPYIDFTGAHAQFVVSMEADMTMSGSGSTQYRFGVLSNGQGTNRAAAAVNDGAFAVTGFSTGNWQNALLLSNSIGTPLATTGTVIGTDGTNFTITNGIDLSALTITGSFLKGPSSNFTVDGSGNVTGVSYLAGGSTPTVGGSCGGGFGAKTGGNTAGTVVSSGICATASTMTLTFALTAPNGWACDASDQTTAGVVFQQTASTQTMATMTVRTTATAAGDVLRFKCMAY